MPYRGVSRLLVTFWVFAVLSGCSMSSPPEDWSAVVLDLRSADTVPGAMASTTLERPWIGFGLAEPVEGEDAGEGAVTYRTPSRVQVRLRSGSLKADDPQAAAAEMVEVGGVDIGRPQMEDGAGGPVVVALDPPGASFTLTGGPVEWPYGDERVVGGVARITFARGFLNAALDIEPEPTVRALLHAALMGIGERDLRAYHALPQRPTLAQVVRLVETDVSPSTIRAYNDAAYTFSIDDLLRVEEAGVPVQDAVAFAGGGFRFDAGELIRLHKASVEPAYAIGLKDAGFAEGVAQIIRVKEAGVAPGYAKRMRELGVAPNDTQLIRLHRAAIQPESVATFQRAKYVVNADTLIRMKQSGVSADDALAFRGAGYDFSLDDLAELARWKVPAAFTLSLMSDAYEPLTADQIVNLRLRRVTPEMVRLLRQGRVEEALRADTRPGQPGQPLMDLIPLAPLDPLNPEGPRTSE